MNDESKNPMTGETAQHALDALVHQASPEEKKRMMQRSLRTLEGDIAEAVAERNASVASMTMAEEKRAEEAKNLSARAGAEAKAMEKAPSSGSGKKFFIIIFSVILVAGGLGAAYYLYLQSPLSIKTPTAPAQTALPSLVKADYQKTIDITGLSAANTDSAITNAMAENTGGPGTISQIIPVTKGPQGTVIESGFDFLVSAGITAPSILSRSLNPTFMLGTYDDQNGVKAPFTILSENFFQNAYAGMISWENSMPDSIVAIFPSVGEASSTATTSQIASYFSIPGNWSDGVIENKDVRLFSAPSGKVLLLYSFVDNNTIVITTSEDALADIIQRLENQTYAR